MSADKQVDYVGAMVALAKVAGEVPMSADTGAVDAAVIDIMAFAMKGAVLGGGDEAWEVVVAKYPTVAESYREMARAALAALQRAQAARVTTLIRQLEDAYHDLGSMAFHEMATPEGYRRATFALEARAALLLAVVGAQAEQGAGE